MNFLQKLRGEVSTTGLDIGNHSIKLIKIRHLRKGYYLEAAGVKELPPGTMEGSEIKNKDALIDSIATLVNQCDPSIVEVVVAMSGHGIISDKCTFKIEANENPEEMILWEASQRSPFDVDDITLDFKILHRKMQTSEMEVLLVAAKNQIMQGYIDLLYEAGLKPVIVDVTSFAMNNCYAQESAVHPAVGTVALVNIGHSATNVTFIKEGIYHSSRDISTAGDFFSKTIQRNQSVSPEDAMNILKGRTSESAEPEAAKQSIEYAAEELAAGIDLAFSYFRSSEKSDIIDKIVLSGGGAYISEIPAFLEKHFQTSIELSDPLSFLEYDSSLFGSIEPQKISALFTIAVGLALRKVGD
jgi:type IV pilus assembly protein PilM